MDKGGLDELLGLHIEFNDSGLGSCVLLATVR
jgi:hypothetical protein